MASDGLRNTRRSSHCLLRGRRRLGVTLIEVVVASVIMGLVLYGVHSFAAFGRHSTIVSLTYSDCASRERLVLERLRRELSRAHRVLYPTKATVADYLVFETTSGARHLIELSPGREHLLLSVLNSGERYILADTQGTPIIFWNLLFQNDGEEIKVVLSFRHRVNESMRFFSHAFTGYGGRGSGLR